MSQATTLQFVTEFTNGQADLISITDAYTRLSWEMSRFPWVTQASLIQINTTTGQYTIDPTQAKILAVFYNDLVLDRLTLRAAEAMSASWRDERGSPIAYVVEGEDAKTFRLYPQPTLNSQDFIFLFGSPFGLDYPAYSVAIIHTQIRADMPDWLDLPLGFEVLAREYERESVHQDQAYAAACRTLAGLLWGMVS